MAGGPIAGCILAGGRSRRMGGRNKALLPLGGRPLVAYVVDRLAAQVGALAFSVERPSNALDRFGLPQLSDPAPGFQGPLGGLLAALRHFAGTHEWVLLAPCDAPFLPSDLARRLHACADGAGARVAVVASAGELQPTFSLWHRGLLDAVEEAVGRDGMRGFKEFLQRTDPALCEWTVSGRPGDPPPFFNINDESALQEAERWLRGEGEDCQKCSA